MYLYIYIEVHVIIKLMETNNRFNIFYGVYYKNVFLTKKHKYHTQKITKITRKEILYKNIKI